MKPTGPDVSWIVKGLEKPGKTQTGLAKALGRSPSMVTALLKGNRQLKVTEIEAIKAYLELRDAVDVVGLANAGPNESIDYSTGQGNLGFAPLPPGATANTVAIEVRGHSMAGIAPDGWYVYYDDVRHPPTTDLLGEICVVGLAEGRIMVKRLMRGHKRNHYDLESLAAETLHDVKVDWAAEVKAILPGRRWRMRD